jgi:hypothetical protein
MKKIHVKINLSPLNRRLILIGTFSILLTLIFSLKNYPDLVEKYYSIGLYPYIRKGFQFLFNYSPFSIGDILYVLLIISMIFGTFQIIRLLVKQQFKSAGFLFLGFILKVEIGVTAFYLLWGINYFRQPAAQRLQLPNYEYSGAQLIEVTSMLIDSVNLSRAELNSSDIRSANGDILKPSVKAIQNLVSFYPALAGTKPLAKSSLLSPLLNYIGTAGYYNPFTGEAQLNDHMPVFTRPFVACHEMAHQMGFGAEDEANFAGFIAGKASDSNLLKYSSYYLAVQEFMEEVWRTDTLAFRQMKQKISPSVIKDLETEKAYWMKYQGKSAKLSSIFYDNYLKANNQPGGLKTYNRMIKLTMAYYKKKVLE